MSLEAGRYVPTIASEALDSPFPLQYFFVIRDSAGSACLHPGLGADLSHQPYDVVHQDRRPRRVPDGDGVLHHMKPERARQADGFSCMDDRSETICGGPAR